MQKTSSSSNSNNNKITNPQVIKPELQRARWRGPEVARPAGRSEHAAPGAPRPGTPALQVRSTAPCPLRGEAGNSSGVGGQEAGGRPGIGARSGSPCETPSC